VELLFQPAEADRFSSAPPRANVKSMTHHTGSIRRGTILSHIGIAVRALDDMLPFYRDVLGLPVTPLDDMDGSRIAGLVAGETLVELLEPDQAANPIAKFLEKRGPGIHHVCFTVDDLDATLGRCRSAGVALIDESPRIGAEGKRIAFLHPKSTGGVLVELSEY
jgi:methylmalonyl-CoA/ethylmalonyl-CoA epimerase